MVIPHALVAFAPNALAQIPSLLSGFPVPDLVIRWNLMLFYPFTILHFIAPVNAPPWMYFDLFHCAVGAAGAGLTAVSSAANLATLQTSVDDIPTSAELATALGTADDAVLAQVALVKAKTDSLTFTVSGKVDANITHVNETEVTGDGETGTEWGPA